MSDEKVTHSDGGFIIPKVAYIDHLKDGFHWTLLYRFSRMVISFGVWIKCFCIHQKDIYPYEELLRAISEMRYGK